ncbi:sigma-E factor negative regulatory protein [Alcanivorax marinus]|uniref:Sigma-E factor negative regulatory protein n=1 Tax=Alloalcanivorax marinus TaxID=1177169 RepID=A0A9Q3UJ57_9GAMM|nr:sigma-E factor negative regulatory protein [Alloalcanivorax marinus]MCC4307947.1 sigma-E factor negative regulatory protein [Alloalcanivorax marinus]
MSRNYEALSAFLDGETTEFETRRVLRDLDRDDLATLGRWQSVSDALHGHAAMGVPEGFNARLSEALASESKPGRRAGMVHGFARVAVAASVAAVTVIGWQYWSVPTDAGAAAPAVAMTGAANDGAAATEASLSAPAAAQRLTRPFGETSLVAQSALRSAEPRTVASDQQPRVNAMLLRHSEFTARHSGQGMMPYVRLVSMDARNGAR